MALDAPTDAVARFVQERSGISTWVVTDDTDVRALLDLAGYDAVLFLDAYAEQFEVDLDGFPFGQYFDPDPMGWELPLFLLTLPFMLLYRLVEPALPERFRRRPHRLFTVRELARWAAEGRWSALAP